MTDDGTHKFRFDRVFGQGASQAEVYEASVHPVIEEVLQGYNGTVFAYGQTSAGKTFTMVGGEGSREGMIPRALRQLFSTLSRSPDAWTLSVSLLEIYMERVYDLLVSDSSRPAQLSVYEDQAGAVHIPGAVNVSVSTLQETLDLLARGLARRAVGAHRMNRVSSRSHAILRVQLQQTVRDSQALATLRTSTLNLVDLAGSEKVTRTEVCDMRLREAKRINQSLLALGNVVNMLSTGDKAGDRLPQTPTAQGGARERGQRPGAHIPYRDSKLTRILSDSLGGNHLTTIIFNLSPCLANLSEILNTLYFSRRAKCIRNRVWVNERRMFGEGESGVDLEVMLGNCQLRLSEQELLIGRLRDRLQACETQDGPDASPGERRGETPALSARGERGEELEPALQSFLASFTRQRAALKAEARALLVTRANREREIDWEVADCLSPGPAPPESLGLLELVGGEGTCGGLDGADIWGRYYRTPGVGSPAAAALLAALRACAAPDPTRLASEVGRLAGLGDGDGAREARALLLPFLGLFGDCAAVASLAGAGADVDARVDFEALISFVRHSPRLPPGGASGGGEGGALGEVQQLVTFLRNAGLVDGDSCVHAACRGAGERGDAVIRLAAKWGASADAVNAQGETPMDVLLAGSPDAASLPTFELLLRCGLAGHRPRGFVASDVPANPLAAAPRVLASSNVESAPAPRRGNAPGRDARVLAAVGAALEGAGGETAAWFLLLLDCCRLHMPARVRALAQRLPRERIQALLTDLGVFEDVFEHPARPGAPLVRPGEGTDYEDVYNWMCSLLREGGGQGLCARPVYSLLAHALTEAEAGARGPLLEALGGAAGRLCGGDTGTLLRTLSPHVAYPFASLVDRGRNDRALDLLLSDSAILLASAAGETPAVLWLRSDPHQPQPGPACLRLLLGTEHARLLVVSLLLGGQPPGVFVEALASPRVPTRAARAALKALSDGARLRDVALLLGPAPGGGDQAPCCLELAALHAGLDGGARYRLVLDLMLAVQARMSAEEAGLFRPLYARAAPLCEALVG